ncbi:MAG: iron-containing redox enzyme family protein [Polyangiaceae bacterium]
MSPESTLFQTQLATFNRRRFELDVTLDWRADLEERARFVSLETGWIEAQRRELAPVVAKVPLDAESFVGWFERLETEGAGQHDPLFPWLAERATLSEMRWFLAQEIGGEAGFEDLVALTQLKMPATAKLELARNYWDEMGQGHPGGMHGPMLERLGQELGLDRADVPPVEEALALGNTMIALAANRRYAFQSIGALGVIELTAPGRAKRVNEGLKRLGIGGEARRYFALHATLDIKHSRAWNQDVLRPLVQENPARARLIAEGALLRLQCGARCFEQYRHVLGLDAQQRLAS